MLILPSDPNGGWKEMVPKKCREKAPGRTPRQASCPVSRRLALALQMLREERFRTIPSELRGVRVVALRRVVEESVVHIRINISRVFDMRGFECGLIAGLCPVHALVQAGIIEQHRRFDLRHLIERRRDAVEGDTGIEIGTGGLGKTIDHAAAPTE